MPQLFQKPKLLDFLHAQFDHSHHCNEGHIEDDWEFIEIFNDELCEDEFGEVEMSDEGDVQSMNGFLPATKSKIKYTILSKADIRQSLEDNITKVCEVLLLTRNEAAIILQHYKWDVNETNTEWLASEVKVRQAVGLFLRPVVETPADATEVTCTRCHANLSKNDMYSASCGHLICRICWEGYISKAISNGPQCLALRCPETSCNAVVGPYLMEQLASEEDKKKLEDLLLRSYLYSSKKQVKWCLDLNCGSAILSSADIEKFTCLCFQTFCWKCSLEAHSPVDCTTANEWITEGDRQSENWVNANATSCPNCNYLYEKSETEFTTFAQCVVCDHLFCSDYGDNWGSTQYHSCIINAESEHKAIIRKSVERYNQYYEAWATCESFRVYALEVLKNIKGSQQNVGPHLFGVVNFVVEAIQQVVECWQFLKWTYVYGYLVLPDDQTAKKNLLEFYQESASDLVKRLQEHVYEYQDFLYKDVQPYVLLQFQCKLIDLTSVTRRYFASLEEGLLQELSEVASIPRLPANPEVALGENSYSQKSGVGSSSWSVIHEIMNRVGDINISYMKFEDNPKWDSEEPFIGPDMNE